MLNYLPLPDIKPKKTITKRQIQVLADEIRKSAREKLKGGCGFTMVVVVDAIILIQCIINIKGNTAALILKNSSYIDFVVSEFNLKEIKGKVSKIYSSSNLRESGLSQNLQLLLDHILCLKMMRARDYF